MMPGREEWRTALASSLLSSLLNSLRIAWASLSSLFRRILGIPSSEQTAVLLPDELSDPQRSSRARVTPAPILCLMRHSKRLDANGHASIAEDAWPDRPVRPYDSPIADHELPRAAALQLRTRGFDSFDAIVSSPYRRCLQTAGILAQELGIRRLIIDNRLGEDLNAADRCWGAAGMAIGEYSYMSVEEAAQWALVDESGAGEGLVHVTWRRDAHSVLTQPDDLHARVRLLPRVCAEALRVCRGSALALLVVTHGDVINHFAPAFDWSPDVGRYRADECGWLVCHDFEPLEGYEGDTVPLEQVPRVLAAEGVSAM